LPCGVPQAAATASEASAFDFVAISCLETSMIRIDPCNIVKYIYSIGRIFIAHFFFVQTIFSSEAHFIISNLFPFQIAIDLGSFRAES
jgi:hypothetical protein